MLPSRLIPLGLSPGLPPGSPGPSPDHSPGLPGPMFGSTGPSFQVARLFSPAARMYIRLLSAV